MTPALPRMITRRELRQLVPYCPQHVLRLEKAGRFPKRIKIGQRRVGWWLHEVLDWIETRNSQNDSGGEADQSHERDTGARREMLTAK